MLLELSKHDHDGCCWNSVNMTMSRLGSKKARVLFCGSLSLTVLFTLQLFDQANVPPDHIGKPGFQRLRHSNFSKIRVDKHQDSDIKDTEYEKKDNARESKHRFDSEARVFRWKDEKWERLQNFCAKHENFQSTTLKTSVGSLKMYIHNIADDVHVSGSLKRTGLWDSIGVYTMIARLKQEPEMGLIDIGSQLGTFSLVAAMMGRHVVAVDPLVENVLRLCQSAQSGNLTSKVTILFTAVSDTRSIVGLRRRQNNLGGTSIVDVRKDNNINITDYDRKFVHSVVLDDILPFVNFPKAFVKVDVEGHEYAALKQGRRLFSQIDIRGILIEWFQIRTTKSGYNLKNMLYDLDFRPEDPMRRGPLDHKKAMTWPNDILWVKRDILRARVLSTGKT